ncbi:uncharacterized protein LOC118086655 [Zootoca vivipara]|uniref:uncharacterized protein LOC118086655 n=1 Tax=Zootoca vivipara TaxID=8524 RepID=UPI00293BF0F2|nr:uncharacterized protein LOC118086655 [Zootoca vivipara]
MRKKSFLTEQFFLITLSLSSGPLARRAGDVCALCPPSSGLRRPTSPSLGHFCASAPGKAPGAPPPDGADAAPPTEDDASGWVPRPVPRARRTLWGGFRASAPRPSSPGGASPRLPSGKRPAVAHRSKCAPPPGTMDFDLAAALGPGPPKPDAVAEMKPGPRSGDAPAAAQPSGTPPAVEGAGKSLAEGGPRSASDSSSSSSSSSSSDSDQERKGPGTGRQKKLKKPKKEKKAHKEKKEERSH